MIIEHIVFILYKKKKVRIFEAVALDQLRLVGLGLGPGSGPVRI